MAFQIDQILSGTQNDDDNSDIDYDDLDNDTVDYRRLRQCHLYRCVIVLISDADYVDDLCYDFCYDLYI